MRASLFICTLAGLAVLSVPALANSWHRPTVYEESNGDYTNYSYDDGLCRYTYNSNRYENRAQASRNGDCDHLMISPDGRVVPMAEPAQQ